MSQQNPSEDLERQYRTVAEQLIARYEWELLAPIDLARRALALARANAAGRPAEAAIGAYCVALHAACSGGEGAARQDQAYTELGRYLYGLVCMRFADLRADTREDVTQSALERVYRSFDHCREPIAFLAFAAQHLLDAVRVARRQERRPLDSLEHALGEAGPAREIADERLPAPDSRVLAADRRAAIEQLLQEFRRAHPRAAQQVAVLRLEWLDDLDDAAIARRLGISLSSVYAARSRIIKTIQSEPKWRARAAELGILPDKV